MTTKGNKTMNRILTTMSLAALLLIPTQGFAGKGATFQTLERAIASGSSDGIVSEVERAEHLRCKTCIDLVMPLIDDDRWAVRDVASWWLAKRAIRQKVRDDMIVRLQSGDSIAARNAAEVLGRFQHPDALMALETAIHDGSLNDDARAAAVIAVGSIGHYDGKAILEGGLTSEAPAVREAAAKGLRDIRGNVDAVAVVDLLSDDDSGVVREGILTVGALRETAAVGALLGVVTDQSQDFRIRRDAAWALGKIGDGSAGEVLKTAAKEDPNMLVRGVARAAYNSLL